MCVCVCVFVCVCVYVCMYGDKIVSVCVYVYVCMYVCMYTDDVRRFFSTLKSNGPIMYIPLYVCTYFSLTKTLKFMYVCMKIRFYVCMC